MNTIRIGALAAGLALSCGAAQALEPWVLYDDFAAPLLDTTRWPDTALERRREQVDGVLRLVQRDTGLGDRDTGRNGASWGTALTRGTPVKQLRANLRVNGGFATTCSNPSQNTALTRVGARLVSTYFNTGNRVVGSNVGDLLAQLYVYRDANSPDPDGVLRVEGWLFLCRDSTCATATSVGGTGSMGSATVGQKVTLTIEWDKPGKQFRFSRDNGVNWFPVSYNTAQISLDDSAEPGNMFKSIGTRTDVPNCSGGPRAEGFIDAQFDNVSVNKSAAP